jgi:hypothetical protein
VDTACTPVSLDGPGIVDFHAQLPQVLKSPMLNAFMRDRISFLKSDRPTSASTTSWPTSSESPRIYDLTGELLTDAARTAMTDYLDDHRRGRLGSVEASA